MAFRYRSGPRTPVYVQLDASTTDIVIGRALTISGATDGYVMGVDGSGEAVIGIAMQQVSSPSSDGNASVLCDISTLSIYEVPPDTGSVTQAILMNTCDVGADGLTANIDASSTDDLLIVKTDVVGNNIYVQIKHAAFTGVA